MLGGMPIQRSQSVEVQSPHPACAGIAFKGNAFGAEEAATTLATNFAGTRAVCERVLPLMPKQSRIVNVCRLASLVRPHVAQTQLGGHAAYNSAGIAHK